MRRDIPIFFEETIRSFLGDKAFHTANRGLPGEPPAEPRRRWYGEGKKLYREVIRKVVKEVHKTDTHTTHKESLVYWAEACEEALNRDQDEVIFTLCLMRLLNVLLGFDGTILPYRIATPAYFQTDEQNVTERLSQDSESMPSGHEYRESTLATRRRLIGQLRKEGWTTYRIALIFNTSEYQIKKLWSGG